MIKQNVDDNIDKLKARLIGHGYVQKFEVSIIWKKNFQWWNKLP